MDPFSLALVASLLASVVTGRKLAERHGDANDEPVGDKDPAGRPLKTPDPALTVKLDQAATVVCLADTLRLQAARKIGVPFINMVPAAWDTYDCHKKLAVYAYIMMSLSFYAEAAVLLALADPALLSRGWNGVRSDAAKVLGGAQSFGGKLVGRVYGAVHDVAQGVSHAASTVAAKASDAAGETKAGGGSVTVAGHKLW